MVSRLGGFPTVLPTRPGTTPSTPSVPTPVAPAPISPAPWRPGASTPWMKPTYDIVIPDNLGRPPRTTDVTIKKGFDGRSPDQVVDLVKSNLDNALHPSNRGLIDRMVRDNHRSFTIAVSNMFVANSPPNRFVTQLAQRNVVTVQMTMSAVNPVVIMAKGPGPERAKYYVKGPNGDYVQVPRPKYPVVAESKIRFSPEPSLTMDYPKWKTPALAGPLSTIEEL
jgi:hypothetical protein